MNFHARAGRNPGLFVYERGLKSCAAGQTIEAPGTRWGRMSQTSPAMMRLKRGQKSETHLEWAEKGETGCVLFWEAGRAGAARFPLQAPERPVLVWAGYWGKACRMRSRKRAAAGEKTRSFFQTTLSSASSRGSSSRKHRGLSEEVSIRRPMVRA